MPENWKIWVRENPFSGIFYAVLISQASFIMIYHKKIALNIFCERVILDISEKFFLVACATKYPSIWEKNSWLANKSTVAQIFSFTQMLDYCGSFAKCFWNIFILAKTIIT